MCPYIVRKSMAGFYQSQYSFLSTNHKPLMSAALFCPSQAACDGQLPPSPPGRCRPTPPMNLLKAAPARAEASVDRVVWRSPRFLEAGVRHPRTVWSWTGGSETSSWLQRQLWWPRFLQLEWRPPTPTPKDSGVCTTIIRAAKEGFAWLIAPVQSCGAKGPVSRHSSDPMTFSYTPTLFKEGRIIKICLH